jgi:hypothetical protein
MTPLLIISIISASIMIGMVIGYFALGKKLRNTIKYQDKMIQDYAKQERETFDLIRRAEFNHHIQILK